jgi:hypothetical protein
MSSSRNFPSEEKKVRKQRSSHDSSDEDTENEGTEDEITPEIELTQDQMDKKATEYGFCAFYVRDRKRSAENKKNGGGGSIYHNGPNNTNPGSGGINIGITDIPGGACLG